MRFDWFYIADGRIQTPWWQIWCNYQILICCPKLFDKYSQSQRCFKTTILSKPDTPFVPCLASYCHNWKENPIIPDWNEFWNVFHDRVWKSVYPGAHRTGIILSFYNLPEITLSGGPHIVTVSGMRGIIVNIPIFPTKSIKRESRNIQLNKLNQFNPEAISSQFKDQTFDNCFEMKMKQTICQIGA